MKRKIFSALMFGALILASATITSCKDYDDDISDLRTEITNQATTLKGLVDEKSENVEKEIAALNSQIKALDDAYKAADKALEKAIEDATNDAKGYADIQAAEAQKAAIAAAKEMVEKAAKELQDGLDAANAKIAEQGETIASLLEADKELTVAVNKAQARADEAYKLAEQAKAQADANSEELKTLKANLEKVTEDLKTIEETLQTQINTMKGELSDVVAKAAANAAAIEAQAAALEDLKESNQKALDALSAKDTELENLIKENQSKIALLEKGVEEAKEMAELAEKNAKAYTDAQLAEAKAELIQKIADVQGELQGNIDQAKKDLTELITSKYTALDEKIDKVNSELTATIKKIQGILDEKFYDYDNHFDLIDSEIETIKSDIEGCQNDIDNIYGQLDRIQTQFNTVFSKISNLEGQVSGINTKIGEVENAYKAADTALQNQITALGNRVTANETAIAGINTAIANINSKLAELVNANVNNLITSIIYQDKESYNVYAQVIGNPATSTNPNTVTRSGKTYVFFPYATAPGYTELEKGTYNIQEWAGYLYATVNPSDIDASKADIQLENSLGAANAAYKLDKAEVAKGHLVTRAKSENGFWRLPVKSLNTINVKENPADNVDEALYALYTTYAQDTLDADGNIKKVTKKVYSHYAVDLNPVLATRVNGTDPTIKGCGETCTKENSRIEYNDLSGKVVLGTNDKRAYKKYVECTAISQNGIAMTAKDVKAFNDANASLQAVLSADNEGKGDTISLVCPEQFTNYEITLKYYVWNYDGSIQTTTAVVMFNKVLWGDDTTVFSVTPENATLMATFSTEYPTFPFVKGDKCVNKTTWSEEAYSVVATPEKGSEAMKEAQIYFTDKDKKFPAIKYITIGHAKEDLNLTKAELAKIKNMQLQVNPGNLEVGKEYKVVVSFYNKVGALINNVIIKYTMNIPTNEPNPWHIEAAFDAQDVMTIAWANTYATAPEYARYNYSGSFFNVNLGFNATSPYVFELTTPEDYQATAPVGKYKDFAPFALPKHDNYQMVVPNAALNGKVDEEHVYNMTAGIKFFGLDNLLSSKTENGWKDEYQIKFLSPIRYSILGTKGHIEGKTYEGMTNKTIKVNYRGSVDLKDALFSAIDPKEAATTYVHFFEARDSRVAKMTIDFAATNSNNALFMTPDGKKGIIENADGTWTLKTSDMVSVTHDTPVKFRMTVTDVWGAVTTYDFDVTVVANK